MLCCLVIISTLNFVNRLKIFNSKKFHIPFSNFYLSALRMYECVYLILYLLFIYHSIFPPQSMGEHYSKKGFHGVTNSFEQIYGEGFYTGELMIRSCRGEGRFPSNLNTVNLKLFINHDGIHA